jgi:hypothetical protein
VVLHGPPGASCRDEFFDVLWRLLSPKTED